MVINFKNFLLCSINLDPLEFLNYMNEADVQFFRNEKTKSIGKCEFLNLLKDDKYVSTKTLKSFITKIDIDQSDSISSTEFFEYMIKELNIKIENKLMEVKDVEDFIKTGNISRKLQLS